MAHHFAQPDNCSSRNLPARVNEKGAEELLCALGGGVLKPVDILRFLYREHSAIFKNTYSNHAELCKDLGLALGPVRAGADIAPSTFSKVINNTDENAAIDRSMAKPEVREKIAVAMSLPGLFCCKSEQQIERLVADRTPLPPATSDHAFATLHPFLKITEGELEAEPLADDEFQTVKKLAKTMKKWEYELLHWNVEPWVGATYVACNVLKRHAKSMYLVRASRLNDPYAAGLTQLRKALNIGDGVTSETLPEAIITELRAQKAILIVADTCYLSPKKSDMMRRVIAESANDKAHDFPHLLTIGRSDAVEKTLKETASLPEHIRASLDLNAMLRIDHAKCFPAFKVLRDGFLRTRGEDRYDEGGSRLKQARALYPLGKSVPHPIPNNRAHASVRNPTAIRFHAFFASNTLNFAHSDPTGGFLELAGMEMERMPLSIRIAHDDIVAHLRRVANATQKTELRSYRYCSTAKHWLSDAVFVELQKKYGTSTETAGYVPELTKSAFHRIVGDPKGPFLKGPPPIATSENLNTNTYRIGLAFSALTQEEWKVTNPFERSVAHWRIAKYLYENRDHKGLLQAEFPYSPHWGRARFFFLGECIRNLMRTCAPEFNGLQVDSEIGERFPMEPDVEIGGCNPANVLKFCFVDLFQNNLNGNSGFGRPDRDQSTGRFLTKRHGAFLYSAELLQLMSDEQDFGKPHRALEQEFHSPFIRECGYSMLDIGELEKALECFINLTNLAGNEASHNVRRNALLDRGNALLDQALVFGEMMEIARAEDCIRKASEFALEAGDWQSDSKAETSIGRRILSRQIQVHYLNNRYDDAYELIETLQSHAGEHTALDSEIVHIRIAILAKRRNLDEAVPLCLKAVFNATSQGFQHEALGFRIALAHLFRAKGELEAAERILDDAQADIYRYGCSERTYLNFLREAGRNLLAQGRFLRSYTSYLRPCLMRAQSRKFERFAQSVIELATECLENLIKQRNSLSAAKWADLIEKGVVEEQNHRNGIDHVCKVFSGEDPLFGYYPAGDAEQLREFTEKDSLEKGRDFLSGIRIS